MMLDPEQSYDSLAARFCQAQYGVAAKPILMFINTLQAREKAADTALGSTSPNALPYLDFDFFKTVNALLDEAERLAADQPAILRNIVRERVPADAALLNLNRLFRDNLPAGGNPPCDLAMLFARYETNSYSQENLFYNSDAYGRNLGKLKKESLKLDAEKARFLGNPLKLPAEFKDKEVEDIWIASATLSRRVTIVDDPDSPTGKAGLLPDDGKKEAYHKLPFSMGIYCRAEQTSAINKDIPLEDIPQDGKFHLYALGKHTLEPTTIFWAHWTWLISIFIDTAYLPAGNNEWEVYASIKLVGQPYQKDSQEPGKVLVDRVLLVR